MKLKFLHMDGRLVFYLALVLQDVTSDYATRRLEEHVNRRLNIESLHPDELDARGLLPAISFSGFQLRHVYLLDRAQLGRVASVAVPEGYRPPNAEFHERRLRAANALDIVSDTEFKFRNPREKVRTLATLCAAALPIVAYNDTDALNGMYARYGMVYDDADNIFGKEIPNMSNITTITTTALPLGATTTTTSNVNTTTPDGPNEAYKDSVALNHSRTMIRMRAAAKWTHDYFAGVRNPPCVGQLDEVARCQSDYGVAISVYEDTAYQILIFHGGWTQEDDDYIVGQYQKWIIEEFEYKLQSMWTYHAQQDIGNMAARKGSQAFEFTFRCTFKDVQYKVAPDVEKLATETGQNSEMIEQQGLWVLIKVLVRKILPQERITGLKTTLLTGFGMGGTYAAYTSMWLVKMDDTRYDSYVFGPIGWQCAARHLTRDMDASVFHRQIHVYAHVMDVYSGGIDRRGGTVCLFGLHNFTLTSPEYKYCSQIVGYSGPQLFHRTVDAMIDTPEVANARKALKACQYFTHSIWNTAILFADDMTLLLDGTTDGGCHDTTPVPTADTLERCPVKHRAGEMCAVAADTVQPLPFTAMAALVGGLCAFILCSGIIGFMCLKSIQNDNWVYGKDIAGACSCCLRAAKRNKGKERQKEAQKRARENRTKQMAKDASKSKAEGAQKIKGAVSALKKLGGLGGDSSQEAAEPQKSKKGKKKKKKGVGATGEEEDLEENRPDVDAPDADASHEDAPLVGAEDEAPSKKDKKMKKQKQEDDEEDKAKKEKKTGKEEKDTKKAEKKEKKDKQGDIEDGNEAAAADGEVDAAAADGKKKDKKKEKDKKAKKDKDEK